MKFSKIYAVLFLCFWGSTTISAQSMLGLYFGGNKDSLIKEATKLIYTPEPTFKQANPSTEPNPEAIADNLFEQVHKS